MILRCLGKARPEQSAAPPEDRPPAGLGAVPAEDGGARPGATSKYQAATGLQPSGSQSQEKRADKQEQGGRRRRNARQEAWYQPWGPGGGGEAGEELGCGWHQGGTVLSPVSFSHT